MQMGRLSLVPVVLAGLGLPGPNFADDTEIYTHSSRGPVSAAGAAYIAAITTYRDSAYLSLVQAPACGEASGTWTGNLKKLRLAPAGASAGADAPGTQVFLDAQSPPVTVLGDDGRIRPDALSYWTDADQAPELAAGDLNGNGIAEPAALNPYAPGNPPGVQSGRDGGHVTRGGSGQKSPGFRSFQGGPGDSNAPGRRHLYYLSQDSGRLAPLNLSDAVADDLGQRLRPGGYAPNLAHDPDFPAYTQRHHVRRLLRFIRGQDVTDQDGQLAPEMAVNFATRLEYSDPEYTESRQWLTGDSPHGQALVIDYGASVLDNRLDGGIERYSAEHPALFIVTAGNDGLLRLIRDTTANGVEDGQEVWAFMPDEAMAVQERLLERRTARDGEYAHPYALDGDPVALVLDRNRNGQIDAGTDRVVLIVGLRRAGRAYYAIDISNPYQPAFLWKIDNAGRRVAGSGAAIDTRDYAELGLTYSRPRAGLVVRRQGGTGSAGTKRLALFIGGGYDGGPPASTNSVTTRPGKDHRGTGTDDRMGNAIFVLDAVTGELIWKAVHGARTGATDDPRVYTHAELRDSIPSALTVIDTDGDGVQDRILVGDTGGNLWRADLGPRADPAPAPPAGQTAAGNDWQLARLACLGRHGGPLCSALADKRDDRRFFHPPDLVQLRDGEQRRDVVLIGSGDRENPLDLAPAAGDPGHQELRGGPIPLNRLYAITDPGPTVASAGDVMITNGLLENANKPCANESCPPRRAGWYLDLQQQAADGTPGEKVLSTPITVAHTVYVTSYIPPPREPATVCDPGRGSLYSVRVADGAPASQEFPSGPPATGAARHRPLTAPGIPAQPMFLARKAVAGGSTGSPAECRAQLLAGTELVEVRACARFRTYWRRAE